MILHGNQRGCARELALHLLKDENDHVDVHEIRGFVSDDVKSALDEVYAISRGTKAKQYLYSLSLNPPANENVSTQDFKAAIERVEQKLGLDGQARVIVFHEKLGIDDKQRRHAHVVWSRIDTNEMKAIPLPFTKLKLQELSRELYLEHGWDMPEGFLDKNKRSTKNFTLAEWQQAKRSQKDPKKTKTELQSAWAESDDQTSLQNALKERGYVLAQGNRRSFVVIDNKCEIHSLPKRLGLKTKDVRTRINEPDKLPLVDEAKVEVAQEIQERLTELQIQQQQAIEQRQKLIEEKRKALIKKQAQERRQLKAQQQKRWAEETKARQARLNKGLKGLLDRFTGKKKRIQKQNERDTLQASIRDQNQRDKLVFIQKQERQALHDRAVRLETFRHMKEQSLNNDIQRFREIDKNREHGPEI